MPNREQENKKDLFEILDNPQLFVSQDVGTRTGLLVVMVKRLHEEIKELKENYAKPRTKK